jgi:hypothetical protein
VTGESRRAVVAKGVFIVGMERTRLLVCQLRHSRV